MIHFWQGTGGSYGVRICAGPNNLFLPLKFAATGSTAEVTQVPYPGCPPVDPAVVRAAVLRGVAEANAACGTALCPGQIKYQIEWPWAPGPMPPLRLRLDG